MMEYYVAARNNKNMQIAATWMKLEAVMLNEVSHKNKDKHRINSLFWGIIGWKMRGIKGDGVVPSPLTPEYRRAQRERNWRE